MSPAPRDLTLEQLGWLAWPLGDPAIHWRGRVQPVPQHRPRVTSNPMPHGYQHELDVLFRSDIRTAWREAKLGKEPLRGPLALRVIFAGRTRSVRLGEDHRNPEPDVSNVVKAIEDAGNHDRLAFWGGLWVDDRQVKRLEAGCVAWGPDVRPFIDLTVWRLLPPADADPDQEFEAAIA